MPLLSAYLLVYHSVPTRRNPDPMQLPAYLDQVLASFTDLKGRAATMRWLRRPQDCMTALKLSAMKSTRVSFAPVLARQMIRQRWVIERKRFHCDSDGDGHGIYSIRAGGHDLTYIARCFRWDGIEKVGRRSDGAKRDMFGAVFHQRPDEERIAREFAIFDLRDADRMRTDSLVTGWTPANRSARFFDHVVDCLTAGQQPDPGFLGSGTGYLLRNGGYLGSGRNGSLAFEGIPEGHVIRHPFFGDLFGLYLVRQVSIDLVNGIAAARNPKAARLAPEIARYIGVGNSSGQGMCVALQRWPHWVSTWLTVRELALAFAKSRPAAADRQRAERLRMLVSRASDYYRSTKLQCEDYVVPTDVLAGNLNVVRHWVAETVQNGALWGELVRRVEAQFDGETVEQLNSLLLEIYPEFADACAGYLPIGAERERDLIPEMAVGELKALLRDRYDWALRCDMRLSDARRHFWYHSADNGEQRRGERIIDPHEEFESFIDHIGLVQRLASVLTLYADDRRVAEVVSDTPDLAFAVSRVQYLADLPYAEIRDNLIHKDFIPAHLIRFFLAALGMECTNPLSIRYVRGVFFQGMPLPEEIARGAAEDWIFPMQPGTSALKGATA
jgi:hypothetical protein